MMQEFGENHYNPPDIVHSVFSVLKRRSPGNPPMAAVQVLTNLQQVYDGELSLGESRHAPSEWWRQELELLPPSNVERWVTRYHLFEKGPSDNSRYIGFANVRPDITTPRAVKPLLADAFLAPPSRMLHAGYHLPAVSEVSQIYGDHYFACLPYVMQGPEEGFLCGHACLYMAMLMMLRFDARLVGPWDMTVINSLRNNSKTRSRLISIKPMPLNLRGCAELLAHSGTGLRGNVLVCEPGRSTEFLHLLSLYVEAGIPVIVNVDAGRLYPQKYENIQSAHAILLVGTANNFTTEPVFVFHDPAEGPYREVKWSVLARSLFHFSLKGKGKTSKTSSDEITGALAVAPDPLCASLTECTTWVHEILGTSAFRNSRAELVAGDHFVSRLARVLASPFQPTTPPESEILKEDVAGALHAAKIGIPKFSWMISTPSARRTRTSLLALDATVRAGRPLARIAETRRGSSKSITSLQDFSGKPLLTIRDRTNGSLMIDPTGLGSQP